MICPECKGRTEVLEVSHRGHLTRRRRRCLEHGHRFSTLESIVGHEKQRVGLVDAVANVRGRQKNFDAEAIAAAIAVDRRKAKIAREQRARYEDEHAAPRHLRGDVLRRELKGY